MKKIGSRKTIWFIASVLLFSWILSLSLAIFDLNRNPLAAVMIFPMIVAVVFMLISKEKFSAVGWKWPKLRYMLLSLFLPLLQMAAVVAIGYTLDSLSFNSHHYLSQNPTPYAWMNVILCIPAIFIPFILLSLPRFFVGWVSHLGEEFAWRGYLFRRLSERDGIVKAVLVSGIVWWAWHLPMFWLSPVISRLPVERLALMVLLSIPSMVGTACVFSWAYVKSASIWAPTIMHLSWNLFRGVLTGRLSDGEPGLFTGDLWLVNGEGIIGMIVTALTGIVFFLLLLQSAREEIQK